MGNKVEHKIENGIELKYCSLCDRWLPLSEFYNDCSRWDGLNNKCKSCVKQKNKKSRELHLEERRAHDRQYHHEHKQEDLERKRMWRANNQERYKEYNRQYNHKYYEEHKESIAEQKQQYRQEHPEIMHACNNNRRARELNAEGKITKELIEEKLKYYNYCCMYCGEYCGDNYHIEHILPLSRGGSNLPDNIGIACPHCNTRKGSKTYEEFIKILQEEYELCQSHMQDKMNVENMPEDKPEIKLEMK